MIIPSSLNLSVVISIPGEKLWVYISTKNIRNYKNLAKERFNSVWQTKIIKSLIIPQLTYTLTSLPSPGELFLNDTFVGMIIPSSLNLSVVISIPGEKLWVYISTLE
jgi:hypothetical protein